MRLPYRVMTVGLLLVTLGSMPPPACAEGDDYIWNTTLWSADNGQNSSWMWGIGASGPLTLGWQGSLDFRQGQFNQGGDIEENREFLVLTGPKHPIWQAGIGFSYLSFQTSLQRGYSWSYPEEKQERNDDVYGPVLCAKIDRPIFNNNTGLYLAGLLMPYDLGDLDELGYDGRYFEIRGGAYWSGTRLRTTIGYQYRRFDDLPDRIINDQTFAREEIQGVMAELGFYF